jgi:hypothetical protein
MCAHLPALGYKTTTYTVRSQAAAWRACSTIPEVSCGPLVNNKIEKVKGALRFLLFSLPKRSHMISFSSFRKIAHEYDIKSELVAFVAGRAGNKEVPFG